MKKIFRLIIAAVVVSLTTTGCTDLDYENYSKINSENFPVSESDLEAAAIGVYSTLANSMVMQWLNNAGWTYSELTTDELNTGWGGTWQQLDRYQWTANNMQPSTCYNNYQKGITKATRIIDAFEKSSVGDAKKRKYIAELRVLRVLFANYLYDMVGPVPIVTDPAIANDVYTEWKPSRPSNKEYVDFMVSELQAAYGDLTVRQSGEEIGRVSQGMALTLLMKIYLNDKQWQNAAATARIILRFSATLNFNSTGLRYVLSIDGQEKEININGHYKGELGLWQKEHVIDSETTVNLKAGRHTLCIRPLDNALVLQKILVNLGGLHRSLLGPEETLK